MRSVEKIELKDLLLNRFQLEDVKKHMRFLGLDRNGAHEELVERLLASKPYGLNLVLFNKYVNKQLRAFCKQFGLPVSGSRTRLRNRLIEKINIPSEFISKEDDMYEMDSSGRLRFVQLDIEHILGTCFSKGQINELCRYKGLFYGDREKKGDMMREYLRWGRPRVKSLLRDMDDQGLAYLRDLLRVDDKTSMDEMADLIERRMQTRGRGVG